MPKTRTMGAGLAGSTARNVSVNSNTGGGNKKQGLSTTTNKRVQFVSNAIKTRSYGENRNVIFCVNQLGGVGAVSGGNGSRMFGTTSDGVKDCITGPYGCEQVVREAYLEAYGREPDKSGLRTYCIAMTKRRWSKDDIVADLKKNEDSLAPIYASFAGRNLMYIRTFENGGSGRDYTSVVENLPVDIDTKGNIKLSSTGVTIAKITVVNDNGVLSITYESGLGYPAMIDISGNTDVLKKGSSTDEYGGSFPKIDAVNLYFERDVTESESGKYIIFKKDTDKDGFSDDQEYYPKDPEKAMPTGPPTITVNGDEEVTIEVNSEAAFQDPGVTAKDEFDVIIPDPSNDESTSNIEVSGSVDTSTVGLYTVTYTVTDNYGFSSTATRTVNVLDTTSPVITLNGDEEITIEVDVNGNYADEGATATDNDGEPPIIGVTDGVDITQVGVYYVVFEAVDASGNTSVKVRTVNVVDTTSPVITLLGNNPYTAYLGSSVDSIPGAIATDASSENNLTVTVTETVDTNTLGTYTLTYTAKDESNNSASVTRTVNVEELTHIYSFQNLYNSLTSGDGIDARLIQVNDGTEYDDGDDDNQKLLQGPNYFPENKTLVPIGWNDVDNWFSKDWYGSDTGWQEIMYKRRKMVIDNDDGILTWAAIGTEEVSVPGLMLLDPATIPEMPTENDNYDFVATDDQFIGLSILQLVTGGYANGLYETDPMIRFVWRLPEGTESFYYKLYLRYSPSEQAGTSEEKEDYQIMHNDDNFATYASYGVGKASYGATWVTVDAQDSKLNYDGSLENALSYGLTPSIAHPTNHVGDQYMERSGLRGNKPCNCLCMEPYYQTANYGSESNCAIIGFQEYQNYGTNIKVWVEIVDENGNVQTSAGGEADGGKQQKIPGAGNAPESPQSTKNKK